MGSAMQVLALVVLVFGFAAAQEDVSCPGILDCTETAQVCWSHDSSAYGNTCAELKCDDSGIKLLVRSPKETTKVVLEAEQNAEESIHDSSATQTRHGCSSESDRSLGWPIELATGQIPAGSSLGLPAQPLVPEEEPYDPNDDYESMIPEEDPNADYAAQFRSKREANADRAQKLLRTGRQHHQPGGVHKADHGQCGPAARVETDLSYSQGESVVKVTEYLYVNGVVELVTRTVLRLKCSAGIKSAPPAEVNAFVKEAVTAQCLQTNYRVDVVPSCENCQPDFYKGTLLESDHVSADLQVGWRAKTIALNQIDIVENGFPTLSPDLQQSIKENHWDPNTKQYEFSSDAVWDVDNQLNIGANVEYCLHKSPVSARLNNAECGIFSCNAPVAVP